MQKRPRGRVVALLFAPVMCTSALLNTAPEAMAAPAAAAERTPRNPEAAGFMDPPTSSNHVAWQVGLQSDTIRAQRNFPGEIAIYVKDMSTGARYTCNSATPSYLASGIKLIVMSALFRQINEGTTSLEKEIVYTDKHLRDGSPHMNYVRFGTAVSIRTLVEAMIQKSDNSATDILIDQVGLDNVNREVSILGLANFGPITTLIDVRRLVYQELDHRLTRLTPADVFDLGVTRPLEARLNKVSQRLGAPLGTFTALDYVRAFDRYYDQGFNTAPLESIADFIERLASNQIVSPIASQAMLEIMIGTRTGSRRIKAGLPVDTTLAHKTGTQFRRICDFGLFYMPDQRPIVFVACMKGGLKRRAEQAIARLAQRSYWHLTPASERRKIRPRPVPEPDRARDEEDDADEYSEEELLTVEGGTNTKNRGPKTKPQKKTKAAPFGP